MRYKAKKIFGGRVSVRSYIVKYCRKTKQNLIIEFEGQKMTVDYYNLRNYTTDGNIYLAKRTDQYIRAGEKYKLLDYIWRPDPQEIGWTKEGAEKMVEAFKKFEHSI